ncbi:MAG TPA: DNA (cytosine-5-)-methyltransferase [Fibrobacteres bacterium]|nr:DNA (cytosine-5-)-methyltransferase [Fibrobacterota bacterium]
MSLKAVELFAGIGGFRIACDKNYIKTIWANDINEKAGSVYKKNWNDDTFHHGDIWTLIKDVPPHDLLTGGFPCQPFSSAGKKQGIRDPRGTLFQAIVEVISRNNPKYFVLENVKRLLTMEDGQHFATILDSLSSLGYLLEWRLLNTLDFGLAQNRERIVIVGTKNGHKPVSFLMTSDDSSDLPPYIAELLSNPSKWKNIAEHGRFFDNWGLAIDGNFITADLQSFSESKNGAKLADILQKNVDPSFDFTEDTLKRINNSEKVERFVNGVEIIYNQAGGARMGYTIFGTKGIAPTLTSSTSRHYERYCINDRFRRLTHIEYARLQGFADNHCEGISPYDQYVLFGNAVPPPLVSWVLDRVTNIKIATIKCEAFQTELF